MNERQMQSLFGKWLDENKPNDCSAYELKISKGNTLPFNSVKDHQLIGLKSAQNGMYHRIMDQPWINDRKHTFARKKPFDCLWLRNLHCFVVVWFYKPRQKKEFIQIKIETWLDELKTTNRKSLTEQRAKEIGEVIKLAIK